MGGLEVWGGKEEGGVHVSDFGGDDEAVVAYEGFSCCADTLFAVGG